MSKNVKGLLKGLRYISQIFEEEEEDKEIQIGFPTDVKHVAHIGCDGASANSPSWMNDFNSPTPGNSSTPSPANGEVNNKKPQEDSKKNTAKESSGKDLPGLPKSSRRQPSCESIGEDSPNVSPTHQAKSSRRRHKHKESSSSPKGDSSSSHSLPSIPKKSRRKKSKDGDGTAKSSKPKEKGSKNGSRHGSEDGSSKQYNETNSSTSLS